MHMYENLRATKLIADLEGELEKVPEHREGKNLRYELVDAGMAAFAMFFVQSPSFLAAQREMKGRKGRSNAEKLFGLRSRATIKSGTCWIRLNRAGWEGNIGSCLGH